VYRCYVLDAEVWAKTFFINGVVGGHSREVATTSITPTRRQTAITRESHQHRSPRPRCRPAPSRVVCSWSGRCSLPTIDAMSAAGCVTSVPHRAKAPLGAVRLSQWQIAYISARTAGRDQYPPPSGRLVRICGSNGNQLDFIIWGRTNPPACAGTDEPIGALLIDPTWTPAPAGSVAADMPEAQLIANYGAASTPEPGSLLLLGLGLAGIAIGKQRVVRRGLSAWTKKKAIQ
jgi:hypothetical protein